MFEKQPARVFFERPLTRPGSTQRIDVTDKLRVCHLRNGRFAKVVIFDSDAIPTFEKAIALTQDGIEHPRNAGLAPFGLGFVEIGAKPGVVLLRTGPARPGFRMWIGPGDELEALCKAVEFLQTCHCGASRCY